LKLLCSTNKLAVIKLGLYVFVGVGVGGVEGKRFRFQHKAVEFSQFCPLIVEVCI
jgi:hypothetical protein